MDSRERTGSAGALDAILQFANVARPIVVQHEAQGVVPQRVLALVGFVDAFKNVADQQRNVLFAIPQRGYTEGKHI